MSEERILKMNTLLAKIEHGGTAIQKLFVETARFFRERQGSFKGVKKTFVPREGFPEDPSKAGVTVVSTTVSEKMEAFNARLSDYLEDVFRVESTNSAGAKKVELIVEGRSLGHLTALDLMRLKNILSNKELETVYGSIPVRSESEVWTRTADPEYEGREVFETAMISGTTRTTENEEVILKDPNLDPAHLPANYNAKTTLKRRTFETGDYTSQSFSGEWSGRRKAELLRRRSVLLSAVIVALKEVNDTEVLPSNLDVEGLVSFIYNG